MDPLSITASTVAVVELLKEIIVSCYKYEKSVQDRDKDLDRLLYEMTSFERVLRHLELVLETEDSIGRQSFLLDLLGDKSGPVQQCKAVLEALKTQAETSGSFRRVGQALVWPLKKKDMVEAVDNVRKTREVLSLTLDADQVLV